MAIETPMMSCCSPLCSTAEADERIRRGIEASVLHCAQNPEVIEERLAALDEEWSMERTLQVHAGAAILGGLTFGLVSRKWRVLAFIAAGSLVYRAFGGFCPAGGLWRRMGVRTANEIMMERCALKALRGDFEDVRGDEEPRERARRALKAAGFAEG